MGRISFLFPGQGAQYVGMAREFYDTYEVSRRVFEEASRAAGFSLEELCFAENQKINETRYTQPALLTACCAMLEAVKQEGIKPDGAAGLSLGEYCALYAASVMTLEDAVRTVCQRGIYMSQEVPGGVGTMTAVMSRRPVPAEEICAATEGIVTVANYNCPGQQVISGERAAVEQAAAKLIEAGASRTIPLKVDGPFHSPMLAGAGERLRALLEQVEIRTPKLAFVSNVTAREVNEPSRIRELLGRQVYSPVLWQQSVEYMIEKGTDTFLEIGPGRTLTNFVKKINGSVRVLHVERPDDLKRVQEELL